MLSTYPSQRTSFNEKKTLNQRKLIADYIMGVSLFINGDKEDLRVLYRAVEGELDASHYNHVLNPLNSKDPDMIRHQAKMRNYPILKPIVDSYQGELSKMPSRYLATIKNQDSESKMLTDLNTAYDQLMNEIAAKAIQEKRLPSEEEQAALQQLQEKFKSTWKDKRVEFAQEAINIITTDQEINDKEQELLYHWVVAGRYYTKRDIRYNDLDYRVIHPLDFRHSFVASGYVEDCTWAVHREKVNFSTITDYYRDWFPEEDMKDLETFLGLGLAGETDRNMMSEKDNKWLDFSGYETGGAGYIYLYHIEYTTQIKTGIVTYANEIGEIQTKVVDESYKLDKVYGDIEIKWEWLNQKWETKFVRDIYGDARPLLVQRDEVNNTSVCKSSYGGRIINSTSGKIISQIQTGLPYQILNNIYHHKREQLINKNKNKFTFFPVGLIPSSITAKAAGKDPFEMMMYYLESLDFLFFDETKSRNAVQLIQYIKSIDMSLGTYIDEITKVIDNLKAEYWDAIGMNRQRFGDSMASDGKFTTQQAIFRSSIITAEMYRKFKKGQERDMACLLDYSKVAWINGKKTQYITSDGLRAFFSVNPEEHVNTDYGLYVVDSILEKDKLDNAKAILDRIAQNPNTKTSTIIEILDNDNIARIKQITADAEAAEQAYNESIEAAKNKAITDAAEKQAEIVNKQIEIKKYEIDTKKETAIEVAMIGTQVNINKGEAEPDDNAQHDKIMEEAKLELEKLKVNLNERSANLAERKQSADEKNKQEELRIKNKMANKKPSN